MFDAEDAASELARAGLLGQGTSEQRRRAAMIILTHVNNVRAARDMEWWAALAGVDAIAPEPHAVKAWVMSERQHATSTLAGALGLIVDIEDSAEGDQSEQLEEARRIAEAALGAAT